MATAISPPTSSRRNVGDAGAAEAAGAVSRPDSLADHVGSVTL
jgi:hypothetical protein